MSRFRQFFGAFWYAARWPHLARMLFIILSGLFLAGGGAILLTRPHLPDKPERLGFDAVMSLLGESSPRYVEFEAGLDFSKKIYDTGWVPYWGHCPSAEIHPLPPREAPSSAFEKLVGCRVTLTGPLKPAGRLAVRKEQRVLAELPGTKVRILVASEAFKEGDSREAQWLAKGSYGGVLSTYEHAMVAWQAGKAAPNAASFIIHDGSDRFSDEKSRAQRSSYFWVPVKGSRQSMFVRATPELEKSFTGSIAGVLQPLERSDPKTRNRGYGHFSVVTGQALPARYGLVQYRTAKEYNDAEIGVGWPFAMFGALIAAAGLAGLVVFIAAPGLIFDAWKRAFEEVRAQSKR